MISVCNLQIHEPDLEPSSRPLEIQRQMEQPLLLAACRNPRPSEGARRGERQILGKSAATVTSVQLVLGLYCTVRSKSRYTLRSIGRDTESSKYRFEMGSIGNVPRIVQRV